ncbi:hypothetical protein SRABI106_04385 [Rahnella aquatilis]|nr:hypothetical protein SRABI106_04385 [Rahnella aquatilis]
MQIGDHLDGRENTHFHRQHQRHENQPEEQVTQRKAEVDNGVSREHRHRNFTDGDDHRHDEAVDQHPSECRTAVTRPLRPDRGDVFPQVRARDQRHRHVKNLFVVQRRCHKRDVQRKEDHQHAEQQHDVAEDIQPSAVFNH